MMSTNTEQVTIEEKPASYKDVFCYKKKLRE